MRRILVVLLALLAAAGWREHAHAQFTVDPEQPLTTPILMDSVNLATGPTEAAAGNPHRPPNVSPTGIVSPAQFFNTSDTTLPFGLVGRSETAIAVGSEAMNIVIGWNDPNGFLPQLALDGLTGYAFSSDGGNSFVSGVPLPVGSSGGQPVVTRGDPWLDATGSNPDTLYFSNLAARPVTLAGVGITVHRGLAASGVLNWNTPAVIVPPNATDFLDKPSIGADKSGSNQAVYVVTTDFPAAGGSLIELYRSFDAGETWGGPTLVKGTDALGQQGADVVVGVHGEVFVAWERGRFAPIQQILFRASTDQGATFGPLDTIATITGVSLFPPVGYNRNRYNDFPRMAVDFTGPHRGRIYVAYQDATTNPKIHTDGVFFNQQTNKIVASTGGVSDGDIYLKFSDDNGATWSAPTLVSSAAPGDGKAQFWPVVSVEPGGNVDVVYYQDTEIQPQPVNPLSTNISIGAPLRRQSSYRSFVDVFWAQSQDGGITFQSPLQVNDSTSDWSIAASNIIPNFGDYIAGVSAGNRTFCTWGQSRLYDINPGPAVNNRFVPSAAFASVQGVGKAPFAQRIAGRQTLPDVFSLMQNYPNPFNPMTVIPFQVASGGHVHLGVYNTLGQEVSTLVNGYRQAGGYTAVFDAANLPSGVYYYRLTTTGFSAVRKMVVAK